MGEFFKFRLQKVLDIRLEEEEKSKLEFKNAIDEKELVETKIIEIEEKYHEHRDFNSRESTIERKMRMNYLNSLVIHKENAEKELEEKIIQLNEKRDTLMKKSRERKTVERLKEKRMTEFVKEQNRLEQIQNDEFALYSHIRKMGKEVK